MRKGLGKGLGMGYKNIVPRDPFIHGLSAKGVKSRIITKMPERIKEFSKQEYKAKKIKSEQQFFDFMESQYPAIKDWNDIMSDYEVFRKRTGGSGREYVIDTANDNDLDIPRDVAIQIGQDIDEQYEGENELDAKMSATELEKNLSMFIGTEQYHKLSFMPLLATDGVAYLMKEAESYWLFDAIASYQPKLKKEPFQVWILEKDKTGSGAVLKGYRDYSEEKPKKYKPLVTQKIPYTDFPLKKVKIWVENGVALLPSEH